MATPKVANKSGVVVTRDGQRLFGMDAAHYLKVSAKEDSDWEGRVLSWLSSLLSESFPSPDLHAVLRSGVVLIRALNTLRPQCVPRYNRTRLVPLLEMDNISLYLKACWSLGIPQGKRGKTFSQKMAKKMPKNWLNHRLEHSDFRRIFSYFFFADCMFAASDLYKRQDMAGVMRNIEALSRLAPSFGCALAPLDSAKKTLPKMVSGKKTSAVNFFFSDFLYFFFS